MNTFEIKACNSNPGAEAHVTSATSKLAVVSSGYFRILLRIAMAVSLLASVAQWDSLGLTGSKILAADPIYVQQSMFLGPDQNAKDYFGQDVAISGIWAAVGAPGNDVAGKQDQGAVYIFKRTGQIWAFHQKLTASDGLAKDEFGEVALKGTSLFVGAPGKNNETGAAYFFYLNGENWVEEQKLTADDTPFSIAKAICSVEIEASENFPRQNRGLSEDFVRGRG